MEKDQAIQVLIQVAHQALGAGLFKTFSDVAIVNNAIESLKSEPSKEEKV